MDTADQSQDSQRRRGGPARRTTRRGGGRRRLHNGDAIAVNFAPMIDVTFLLLIFFLVTTTFERAEGILSSKLPKETGETTVALPLSPIVVRLHQVGPGIDEVEITLDNMESAPSDYHELTDFIKHIHTMPGFDRSTPVVIVADQAVRWDHVVACWNATLSAGSERIAFGGS